MPLLSGSTPPTLDATATVKGKLKLTNDLGGTADLPTVPGLTNKQPLDQDLTDIAALSPSNDDVIQRKAGAWTNRTMAQLGADLSLSSYVPYTGATSDVDLGAFDITATLGTFDTSVTTPYVYGNGTSITLQPDPASVLSGVVNVETPINLNTTSKTLSSTPPAMITANSTLTVDFANSRGGGFQDATTNLYRGSSPTFAMSMYNAQPVVKNDTGYDVDLATATIFVAQPQMQADGFDVTQTDQRTFVERSIIEGINGGRLYVPLFVQYDTQSLLLTTVRDGGQVRDRYGYHANSPTTAGTGFINRNSAFYADSQTTARDFNFAIYTNDGWNRIGDHLEIDSTDGTKGLQLHTPNDVRKKYTAKAYTGALKVDDGSFDPARDINHYLYYKVNSANVGGVSSGTAISILHDKSANNFDGELGSGTLAPTYRSSEATMNNKPCLEFTAASSTSFQNTSVDPFTVLASGTYTAWAVASFKTIAAAMRVFSTIAGNNNRGAGINATPNWITQGGATVGTGATAPSTGVPYLMQQVITSTSHTLYVNGVSVATSATAGQNASQFVLGAGRNGSNVYANFFDGFWGEGGLMIGNQTTMTNASAFYGYIANEWGITVTGSQAIPPTYTHILGINANTTAVGNVGTGEDDLMTYAIPANFQSATNDTVRFRMSGTISNTANNKRIRVKYGGTTMVDTGAAGITVSTAQGWTAEGEIFRTGSATQDYWCRIQVGTVQYNPGVGTAAETMANAITLKATGEATANNDITQETLKVNIN